MPRAPAALRARALSVAVAVVLLGLTGCPGQSDGPGEPDGPDAAGTRTTAPGASSTPGPGPLSLRERCGVDVAGARPRVITTDKQQLYGVEVGRGSLGVVLILGSGSRGLCNWSAELAWLRDAGLHVLANDQACVGESSCADPLRAGRDLRAAVAELKRRGTVGVGRSGITAGPTCRERPRRTSTCPPRSSPPRLPAGAHRTRPTSTRLEPVSP